MKPVSSAFQLMVPAFCYVITTNNQRKFALATDYMGTPYLVLSTIQNQALAGKTYFTTAYNFPFSFTL